MSVDDRRKKLPIGVENFQKLRSEDFYYVDKTAMIRDLLNAWSEVNLFTRPRRFGKTLNMSMLKTFFEIGCNRELFDGLQISGETVLCDRYMGRFPVISLSLKSVDGADYDSACSIMQSVIGNEAGRFEKLLTESSRLTETEKNLYRKLIMPDPSGRNFYVMSETTMKGSLSLLSALLCKHYGQKVILLIDEYDVPLAKANERGYYAQMVDLIRGIFDQALKTNESLYFAVLTGCLRVAKESIFTDQIMELFRQNVVKDGEHLKAFCDVLRDGNAAEVERQFSAYLEKTISIRDTFVRKPTKENFYHGILLGILGYKDGWYVKSNRESGDGYSDIYIRVEDEDIGIIIEVKYAENSDYVSESKRALAQIEEERYIDELKAEGCHTIYKYGIACFKKKCGVICEKEEMSFHEHRQKNILETGQYALPGAGSHGQHQTAE